MVVVLAPVLCSWWLLFSLGRANCDPYRIDVWLCPRDKLLCHIWCKSIHTGSYWGNGKRYNNFLCTLSTTATILWPLCRTTWTCISWHPSEEWRILLEQFYCPHDLADSNQCIQIREKMLEFSSMVLPARSPYHLGMFQKYACMACFSRCRII